MIINTKQIKKLIKSKTAYGLAKELDIGRANLNNYKNGTYQMDQMTIGLATKLQNYYNKMEANRMYKLYVMEQSDVQDVEYFETFEDMKEHLMTTDYFSWINDDEPEKELPRFEEVEDIKDLETIFEAYDYSWWKMNVEEVNKIDVVIEKLEDMDKMDYFTHLKNVEEVMEEWDMTRDDLIERVGKYDFEIIEDVPVIVYDNPTTTLFNVVFITEDMTTEDILNELE